jgi:hypothetical protein
LKPLQVLKVILYTILGALFALAGLACYIVVMVYAFQDAIWKGLIMFVPCIGGLCWLYYALMEYESDYKAGIVGLAIFGSAIGGAFLRLAAGGGHF